MSERSSTAVEDPRRDHLVGSSAVESQWKSNEMLGAVPIPSEDARCTAFSVRSRMRCKRYRQASSSVCSKHASTDGKHASSLMQADQHSNEIRRSGLGKGSSEPAADTRPWDEAEWAVRFDPINQWICCDLERTNPELAKAFWEFLSRIETELQPREICDVALWLRDVLEGTAAMLNEGLPAWG